MILVKMLRRIENMVLFEAEGASIEAFLYAVRKRNIPIYAPKKSNFHFEGEVRTGDYKKLKQIRQRYGIRLRILHKKGWFFFCKKQKEKIGFFAGCVGIMTVVLFLNLFIWDVRVIGNQTIPAEEILLAARENGIYPGCLKKNKDDKKIERTLVRQFSPMAWVSLNIQGSRATILIDETGKEADQKPDDDKPVNLVASKYGVIRKMNVFDGQKAVEVGDAVMKGDLLVSAVYEDRHNKLTLKHSRAEIWAETDYEMEVRFPLKQTIREKGKPMGKTLTLFFLGKPIVFGKEQTEKDLITEKEEKEVRFLGFKLPIKALITQYYDVKEKDITYNFEQGKDGAFQLLEEKEQKDMEALKILSRTTEEKVSKDTYILSASYIVLMDIAKEQDILSDVPWENTDDMS